MGENGVFGLDSIESFCRESAPIVMKSGRSLVDAHQVKSLGYDPDTATVGGQVQQLHGPIKYYVFVHLKEGKPSIGHCVCSMSAAVCSHMVALLLFARTKLQSLDTPYEWLALSQNSTTNANARPPVDPCSVIPFKIVLVGESGVGKSSMLLGFMDKTYTLCGDLAATVGIDFKKIETFRNGKPIQLKVFDTAGAERFRAMTPTYFRKADSAVVVYDVSQRESFNRMQAWINDVDAHSYNENIVKIVVGNKIDKSKREVSQEEGFQLARKNKALFVESSVKTREGIEAAFDSLLDEMLENVWQRETANTFAISSGPVRRWYQCC